MAATPAPAPPRTRPHHFTPPACRRTQASPVDDRLTWATAFAVHRAQTKRAVDELAQDLTNRMDELERHVRARDRQAGRLHRDLAERVAILEQHAHAHTPTPDPEDATT